jgi:hypothetical protein
MQVETGIIISFHCRMPQRHARAMTKQAGEVFLPASHLRRSLSPHGEPVFYKFGEERRFPKTGDRVFVIASKCKDGTYVGIHWALKCDE